HGEHIKTDWENGNIVLQYKKNGNTDFINAELTPSEDQVIDAGFDQYVRENWPNLVNFEVQDFSYASPPHQANFTMRIKRMDENQCKKIIKNIDQHVCFKAEANNFLFRVFSKPIKLVYDNNKRLKKFYGVTNVLNPNGKNYFSEITYQYQD
ncbi:MAG: hypothetical protein GTO02_13385, partial [Candidatus Dadabacteria bacterium]|nr:hypothetical protein [Candidatus Dadabacteria bacterium]